MQVCSIYVYTHIFRKMHKKMEGKENTYIYMYIYVHRGFLGVHKSIEV